MTRYSARDRHPGHLTPDEGTLGRIRQAAQVISPLGLGPALRVDTTRAVDVSGLAAWVRQQ